MKELLTNELVHRDFSLSKNRVGGVPGVHIRCGGHPVQPADRAAAKLITANRRNECEYKK